MNPASSSGGEEADILNQLSGSPRLTQQFKKFLAQHEAQAAEEAKKFPQLPPGPRPDLGSGPLLTSGATATSTPAVAKCAFASWEDEKGNPLPCIPGAGPGEIPLPDNLDPVTYLLPIRIDFEAWLNVDLYFVSKKHAPRNLVQILPGKVRGMARPAEIDARYGLFAFNILTQWTDAMIQKGTMIPVIDYIRSSMAIEATTAVLRERTRELLFPMIQRARHTSPIKTISVNDMKRCTSQHSPNVGSATSTLSKPGQASTKPIRL
ncbi:hypothetical protein F5Y01DRAFT_298622 [Xylaria sp. FL0043]|nr:hypothetical protein F5Y01DRAFT_298622 [Xylaria sp. FL0043]